MYPPSRPGGLRSRLRSIGPLARGAAFAAVALAGLSAAAAIHSRFPPRKIDPNIPAPVITFDRMNFDFGKIPAGGTVTHDFLVTNTGRATLQLQDVKPVCGCTSTVVGKRELKPGESTDILAAYTAEKGFSGPMRKTILIYCNDPAHPRLTLRMAGTVLAPEKKTPGGD